MNRFCRKAFSCFLCVFCLTIFFPSQAAAVLPPLNDDTEFVKQVYLDFLNRQPDADGLNYWASQLEVGILDRSVMVEQYLVSPEFGETISPVVRLYFTYYLRIPDYDGLMFWVNSYAAGMSLKDISDKFATAQEFIDKYGSLTNEEFASQMYINVYGRQPDSGGLVYWTDKLDTSTLTRGQVMVEFSSAEEYLSISTNTVYVTMTYMGLLRRAPDLGGFDFWVESMDLGVSGLGLIDSFLVSNEYAARFDLSLEVNIDDDGDGYTENQGDCDDSAMTINPGAEDLCGDGIDQDCSNGDLICPIDPGTGTSPALEEGTFWVFSYKSSSSSSASSSGIFRVELGAPENVGGVNVFPVAASRAPSGLEPRCTHLSVVDEALYCSIDGSTMDLLYDGETNAFGGGGFFYDFGESTVLGQTTYSSPHGDTEAYWIAKSGSDGGCSYYGSTGSICSDSTSSWREEEWYKPGIGPLGFHKKSSYSSSVGGYYTSSSSETTVTLVQTNLIATDGYSPFNKWQLGASMPSQRWNGCAVTVGDYIYVLGGSDTESSDLALIERYDPVNESWETVGEMPEASSGLDCVELSGEIFVFGGYFKDLDGNGVVLQYTPDTGDWVYAAHHDGPADSSAEAVVLPDDGIVAVYNRLNATYVLYPFYDLSFFGSYLPEGWDYTRDYPGAFVGLSEGRDFRVYLLGGYAYYVEYEKNDCAFNDPYTGEWTTCTSMPQGRYGHTAEAINGKIYVYGGGSINSHLISYNPVSDSWSTESNSFIEVSNPMSAVYNGKLYILGAKDGSVQIYDPTLE